VKCYLKAGFKEEGRLREDIFYHGKYADAIRMGILRREWA
jgi:RimJ/RimL family protein N-acetyltransferase